MSDEETSAETPEAVETAETPESVELQPVDEQAVVPEATQTRSLDFDDSDVQVRDISKRELDVRLAPWNVQIETAQGPEEFRVGAFRDTNPSDVLLMGMEHEAHLAMGNFGETKLARRPTGKAIRIEERPDAGYATFRVARTQSGDEILALADDRIVKGISIEFVEIPGGTTIETRNGRRVRIHNRVALKAASTTYRPAYRQAEVIAVRSETEGVTPVPADQTTPVAAQSTEQDTVLRTSRRVEDGEAVEGVSLEQLRSLTAASELMTDRLEKLELRSRQDIIIPGQPESMIKPARTGQWMQIALKLMTGERVSDVQVRALSDLITTDNVGVVPTTVETELIGIIDPARPFLETTRQLPTPDSGLTLTVPVIVTRPTAGIQSTEKADITSTPTSITTAGFDAVTIAGGGDISLQLLKRSSPSYLDLYLRLLAEAYAIDGDSLAIATLLNAGVTPGTGYLDAEDLTIGEAWTNAVSVSRLLRPDRMWLSTLAVQKFIDAKANTTNAPLYSNLAADITVGNGAQGFISGLRPVYVPGLDGSGADVLIGPSRGFAWAEDGTFTLQVDVPSKAGKDIALVGILWFAPLYPAAFTSYRFAS